MPRVLTLPAYGVTQLASPQVEIGSVVATHGATHVPTGAADGNAVINTRLNHVTIGGLNGAQWGGHRCRLRDRLIAKKQ